MSKYDEYLKEAKEEEEYTIIKFRKGRETLITRTLPEFIKYFGYTLETGKSYEKEKGNKKINLKPKTIGDLIKNLNNAERNSAANGNPSTRYEED
jgi:hypothetical protein